MQADNCIGITEKNHYRKVLTDGIVNFDRQGMVGPGQTLMYGEKSKTALPRTVVSQPLVGRLG